MTDPVLTANYVLQRGAFTLDVDLSLPMRGIMGVYGVSGSGKTSLLRCIAGLEANAKGRLTVGGQVWEDSAGGVSLPVHEREIGYVFQDGRVFTHLDVRGNLDYGRRRRGASDAVVDVDAVVSLLGLRSLLDRRPADLSGGELQRVAIARALLRAPKFVLMDEPLASLDNARKDEVLPFLDRLHSQMAIPIIYVSHSIEEICRLCDHLVVIDRGRVQAVGELTDLLSRLDLPILNGEQAGTVLECTIADYHADDELTRLRFSGGEFWAAGRVGEMGSQRRLRVRANDVSLCRRRPEQSTILNVVPVEIDRLGDTDGAMQLVRLKAGSDRLLARISRRSSRELGLCEGLKLYAQVKAAAVKNPPPA